MVSHFFESAVEVGVPSVPTQKKVSGNPEKVIFQTENSLALLTTIVPPDTLMGLVDHWPRPSALARASSGRNGVISFMMSDFN